MTGPDDEPARVKLAVDFEFASRTWWDEGGQDLWDGITEGFEESSVVLDTSIAESWLTEARKIEGWSDGHEFAPHPIAVREVEEDDEDY